MKLLIGLLVVLLLSYVLYVARCSTKEGFEDEEDADKGKEKENGDYKHHSKVIDSYIKVLDRTPTAKELFVQSKRLKNGDIEADDFIAELFMTKGVVEEPMIGDDATNPAPSPVASTVTLPSPALAPNGDKQPDPTLALSKAAGPVPEVAVSDRKSRGNEAANASAASAAKTAAVITAASDAALKARAEAKASMDAKASSALKASEEALKTAASAASAAASAAAAAPAKTVASASSVTKTSSNGTTIVFERPTIYNYYGAPPAAAVAAPGSATATIAPLQKDTNAGIPAQTNAKTTTMIAEVPVKAVATASADEVLNKDAAAHALDQREIDKQGAYNAQRNMNELRYACQRNTKFSNADDSMKLFPEFKWSVPQERAPVCMVPKGSTAATVSPLSEQTALIGTLLSERQDMMITNLPLASDQKTGPRPAKK
jgi:hypothetical protein